MHERAERVVTALLDEIQRAVKLARLRGGEPREAQPVESLAQDGDVLEPLRPTHFECRVERPTETMKLWGAIDASGALLLQGIEVEPRASS
jgi:hypothetical protein